MDKIIKRALMNSVGTAAYIILVVSLIWSLQAFSSEPSHAVIIPIAMLLLLVCSAAITGFLVFGKPVMLYVDGKKRDSIRLLSHTLGMLILITLIAFILLIIYFRF